jgi:hypothetical protein
MLYFDAFYVDYESESKIKYENTCWYLKHFQREIQI